MSTLEIEPLVVSEDADPIAVVRSAAARPETRLIGVIDRTGILVGVVPTVRLAETVIVRVAPETLLAGTADLDEATRFGTEIGARRMKDIMLAPAVVLAEDTIDHAFGLMHRRHLSGVYVVDADGRPIGYLDLLEVTIRYLETLEAADSSDR